VIGPDAALNVAKIVLEGADRDRELVPEVVKHPLSLAETLDDLLAAGEGRAHRSVGGA